MPVLQWSQEYSVGLKTFDDDHRKLIGFINDLCDIAGTENAAAEIPEIFNSLVEFTLYHFVHEEETMREHGFLGLQDHILEHNKIRDRVADMIVRIISDPVGELDDLVTLLIDWLEDHMNTVDKEYGPFLKEKGIP